MGWYTRQGKRYYFRSHRHGNTVSKVYFGSGPVAEFAAQVDRLRQFEKKQDRERWQHEKELMDAAVGAFAEMDAGADVMRDAVLLTAGFYRPGRHAWRTWNDGRQVLERNDRDRAGGTAATEHQGKGG